MEEAARELHAAIGLRPDCAEAHCNLGHLLSGQGQFAEALAAFKRGHQHGARRRDWRSPSAEWIKRCELLVEAEAKLPAVLKGEAKPADAAEQITLALICQNHKKLNAAAARFYADGFAANPRFADDRKQQYRYDAACSAALAGCGKGEDAARLDDKERTRLRQQALTWLGADLAAWRQMLDREPDCRHLIRKTMRHWQQDRDFAGVRGEGLSKLPERERQEWQKLWEEVEMLHNRAM